MINNFIKQRLPAGRRGFTLIETLVAVMILATAIAGPLTLASRALNTSLIAKDQITAYYLAQDAIEYVRYARDTNRLQGGDWLSGAGAADQSKIISLTNCVSATGCYLDSVSQSPASPVACNSKCSAPLDSTKQYLYYNSTTGLFSNTSSGNTKQIFLRKVSITQPNGTDEATLTVTIYWADTGGTTRSVVVNETLYNWE